MALLKAPHKRPQMRGAQVSAGRIPFHYCSNTSSMQRVSECELVAFFGAAAVRARPSLLHIKKALASKWYNPEARRMRPVGRYKIWPKDGLTLEEMTFSVGHTIYTFASIPEMHSSHERFFKESMPADALILDYGGGDWNPPAS
jgi:hypothetical protein